ncbi:hypothetical protein [Desulfovibrio sp. TomC]|uniref:hypothetical protein n=1 Tax=Desulfovibrio sp. TomC TaxID=1562888 RepID=UPI0012E1979A|nr:hypothetical protein [Desulfovibrio sp. TomC]
MAGNTIDHLRRKIAILYLCRELDDREEFLGLIENISRKLSLLLPDLKTQEQSDRSNLEFYLAFLKKWSKENQGNFTQVFLYDNALFCVLDALKELEILHTKRYDAFRNILAFFHKNKRSFQKRAWFFLFCVTAIAFGISTSQVLTSRYYAIQEEIKTTKINENLLKTFSDSKYAFLMSENIKLSAEVDSENFRSFLWLFGPTTKLLFWSSISQPMELEYAFVNKIKYQDFDILVNGTKMASYKDLQVDNWAKNPRLEKIKFTAKQGKNQIDFNFSKWNGNGTSIAINESRPLSIAFTTMSLISVR